MIYAMLAITVDILWGFAGILTFGQAAFFGLGAYAAAMVFTHIGFTPATIALAVVLSVLIPVVVGLLVGWLSFYHGSTPLYASVISLVFPIVVTQVLFSGGVWTGSSSGLVGYDTLPLSNEGYFRLTGFALVLVAVAAWLFVRSDVGRMLVAIRDNEMRCAYLGINTARVKIILMAALAAIAGIAGFLYANASAVVAPEIGGFVFGTELVIWVALGGRATILGPMLSTIAIDMGSAYLSGDLPFLWKMFLGIFFVVVIVVLPNGLAAIVERLWRARPKFAETNPGPTLFVAQTGAAGATGSSLLEVIDLGKSYGSLKVLESINIVVRPGELVSLVGPNGAGKTTLMRCLSDGTERITGAVRIASEDIAGLTPNRIVALGVGRKFQMASVFDSLTVAECLRLARISINPPSYFTSALSLTLPAAALEILRITGLDRALTRPARLLSHGQKQALELAMVVALEPKLVLLDEPTAGLTKAERTTIGGTLRNLTSTLGFAAILVEHDLDFVRDISSRIVVLHQGRLILDGTVEEVVSAEIVKTIYSGGGHA